MARPPSLTYLFRFRPSAHEITETPYCGKRRPVVTTTMLRGELPSRTRRSSRTVPDRWIGASKSVKTNDTTVRAIDGTERLPRNTRLLFGYDIVEHFVKVVPQDAVMRKRHASNVLLCGKRWIHLFQIARHATCHRKNVDYLLQIDTFDFAALHSDETCIAYQKCPLSCNMQSRGYFLARCFLAPILYFAN